MSPDTRPDPLADLLPIIDAAEAAVAAGALPVDVLNITQPVRYAIAHAGVTLTQTQPDACDLRCGHGGDHWLADTEPHGPSDEPWYSVLRSTPAAPQPDPPGLRGAQLRLARMVGDAPQPDAGLREAAQPFLEAALDVFPEDWISPGSSYAIAITVRGSEVDALRDAIRSTPAAHDAGSRTECSLVGVHAHSFRGPHVFREWEPGTQPDARPTGVTHRHPPCDPDNCYIDTAVAASLRPTGDTALREAAQAHADVTHSHENHGEVIATLVDLRAALASPAPTAAPGLDWTIVCDRHRAIGFHGAVVGCLDCGRAALTPSTPDEEATR